MKVKDVDDFNDMCAKFGGSRSSRLFAVMHDLDENLPANVTCEHPDVCMFLPVVINANQAE